MAQSSKRGAAGPARSASSPPALAPRPIVAKSHGESKSPAHFPDSQCRGGGSSDATATPASTTTTTSLVSASSSGSRTPVQRCPGASTAEADLRTEGEFVTGGVELPPAPEKGDGEPGAGDESAPDFCTRPLPPLADRQLEEFWPPGEGSRALFLDYDGTLREFEARPELATPTPEIDELLRAINARSDFSPHIISGRDASFLGTYFGHLNNFTLIAEHGFQIWRPGAPGWKLWEHPDGLDKDHDDWKEVVRAEMAEFVRSTPGSHVEEKASSLVWHYREVADSALGEEAAGRAMERLELVRERNNIGKIRISNGHKVVEVSYRKVRKGPVMRRICEEKAIFGTPFLSVFVAGDDTSDESMFDIAPDDFLTVKVGPALTHAKFRVDSPAQLREFLRQLAA
mmetsp:Transcript_13248/g.41828  ORF Transcript_13248/g.41828 Transcript_13248/m.41828 type:complete len:400 (+) Transcript_13248:71-1270(+)